MGCKAYKSDHTMPISHFARPIRTKGLSCDAHLKAKMSPQTIRNPHGPRRQDIPANFTQKWQSSPRQVARPQTRRPKTACERCRTAKVRCHGDGQNECDRCTSRGLPCRYAQSAPSPGSTATPSSSDPDRTTIPEKIRDRDLTTDNTHELASENTSSIQKTQLTSAAWPNIDHPTNNLEQQQQFMDWSTVDPALILDLSATPPSALTPASQQQPSLESLGLFPLITSTTSDNLPWQDQLTSQSCQCRGGLAQLIPNARTALQERRLDGVFRVTRDVLRRCEGIVGCGACSVNCTDLICIMAVFQEVDGCFEYVAKGDSGGAIKVSMGSYEVEIGADDQDAREWRRMLVTQLVRRAHRLLDLISARGQEMLRQLDPGCRLGRVNINYLETVIGNSRENLHNVLDSLEKAGTAE